jgi:3-oxoacyl-(acyl-carrier-protein) synthase
VPGIATLRTLDPACEGLPVSSNAQQPRSNVAMILCRGFAGTNAALLVRSA